MRSLFLLTAALQLFFLVAVAAADETVGEVHLVAGQFILLRNSTGPQVVKTGFWTAFGNLENPGSLKHGGERVRVGFDHKENGIPVAVSVAKEVEYSPAVDREIAMEQLSMELPAGRMLLVDCREMDERAAGYIPGSVPLTTTAELVKKVKGADGGEAVVFYATSAGDLRPYAAAREATSAGLTDIRIFADGLMGWRRAGRPVYVSPSHLADRIAAGAAFRLIDLRPPIAPPLLAGAENIPASTVTRDAMFLPQRSYQLPLFLYGDEQESLAVAAKLAEWNYHQDGDFAILDSSWKGWQGKYDGGDFRAGQLPASEIGMTEFVSLWQKGNKAKLILNVKPKRDRSGPDELHIPLEELPGRVRELPREKEIIIYCSYGLRSAVAWQILRDNGYHARFLNRTLTVDSSGNISSDN